MPTTTASSPASATHLPPISHAILMPSPHQVADSAAYRSAGVSLANAARLVGVYTDPGDLVVDLYGTGLFAAAAARAGRRATTVVTDSAQRDAAQSTAESAVDPARRGQVRTVAAPTDAAPDLLAATPARVRLLITRLPLDGRQMTLWDAGRWMTACRHALVPHGYLIAAINPTTNDPYVDHATTVITAARAAGFIYHQHLLGIADRLPEPDGEQPPPPRLPTGARHKRVHTDLIVLANGASHA